MSLAHTRASVGKDELGFFIGGLSIPYVQLATSFKGVSQGFSSSVTGPAFETSALFDDIVFPKSLQHTQHLNNQTVLQQQMYTPPPPPNINNIALIFRNCR
jgi:hypothetical protein